jgi:hypothetical protein
MSLQKTAAEISANLEYPMCSLCGSDRREFPFRLRKPHNVVRCVACGLHCLYPRLIESAMQEAYRESSYYEGGDCAVGCLISLRRKSSYLWRLMSVPNDFLEWSIRPNLDK